MKALEKDRSRRYETANGLARDIRRHLDGHAVEAGPPSARYRIGKFARRHRAALAVAAAGAGLLIAATAVSGGAAVWAGQQPARVRLAEQAACDQQEVALRAAAWARKNQRLAEQSAQRAKDQRACAQERETIAVDAILRYVVLVRDTPQLKHDPALASLRKVLLEAPQDFFQKLRHRLEADGESTSESLARLGAACFELGSLAAEVGNKEESLRA